MPPPPTTTQQHLQPRDLTSLTREADILETELKSVTKRASPEERSSSTEILSRFSALRDILAQIVVRSCIEGNVGTEVVAEERLWKHLIHKRIDGYRKALASATNGSPLAKKLSTEFKTFLSDTRDFYSAGLLKPLKTVHNDAAMRVAHHVCIRIGDVARYKEMVNDLGQKRWGEAEAWYRRAIRLQPEDGVPHNQLAVLAAYEMRYLMAIYRYQRALAVFKPFNGAKENLAGLFHTLLKQQQDDDGDAREKIHERIQKSNATISSADRGALKDAFISRFLKFHGRIILDLPHPDTTDTSLAAEWIYEEAYGLLKHRCITGEGGEVFVALCCISIFSCWAINADKPQNQLVLAQRALNRLTLAFVRHALDVASESTYSSRLEKALVSVTILFDYFRLQALESNLCEDDEFVGMTKRLGSRLRSLCGGGGSAGGISQHQELVGFLPLPSTAAVEVTCDQLSALLEDRMPQQNMTLNAMCERICAFAKALNRDGGGGGDEDGIQALTPFVAPGTTPQVLSNSDDEEEIILFQPAFAKRPLDEVRGSATRVKDEIETEIWGDEGLFVPSFLAFGRDDDNERHGRSASMDYAMPLASSSSSSLQPGSSSLLVPQVFQALWGPPVLPGQPPPPPTRMTSNVATTTTTRRPPGF